MNRYGDKPGIVRPATVDGDDYLVADFVSRLPDRMYCPEGWAYYPGAAVKSYDGVPVTLGHPKVDGELVLATDERSWAAHLLGFVTHDRLLPDGRRVGWAWFEKSLTKRKAGPLWDALLTAMHGDPVEPVPLSVGLELFGRKEPGTSLLTGLDYDFCVTDARPDHIAVGMDLDPRCPVSEGCGLLLNH
jgi:hypothetical protein